MDRRLFLAIPLVLLACQAAQDISEDAGHMLEDAGRWLADSGAGDAMAQEPSKDAKSEMLTAACVESSDGRKAVATASAPIAVAAASACDKAGNCRATAPRFIGNEVTVTCVPSDVSTAVVVWLSP